MIKLTNFRKLLNQYLRSSMETQTSGRVNILLWDNLVSKSLGLSTPNLNVLFSPGFRFFLITSLILYFNFSYSQNPNWIAPNPASFNYNANVTALIYFDNVASNNINDRLAFFSGNEIRGLGVPVQIGDIVYHFVSVYANLANETMQVKVYLAGANTVYDAVQPFQFIANHIYGDINNPWIVDIYPNNNSPLNINNIPTQQTLEGLPFDAINLQSYLVQPDSYDVEWTVSSNSNLIVDLIDSFLIVEGESGFTGQTTLTVTATELFGSPQQQAFQTIIFNVDTMYSGPAWQPIPNQGIVAGNQFVDKDLQVYEYQFGGNNIKFDYVPILTQSNPPTAAPAWTPNSNFSNTMNITAKIFYTPKYDMQHNDDVLAAFINNEVRGVAVKDSVSGLYFLSIASSTVNEPITLKFYSGALKKILTLNSVFFFMPSSIIGDPENPYPLDFAPIIPNINIQGNAHFTIMDTTFIGEVKFGFIAYDSMYQQYLHAETETSLCIVASENDLDTFYVDADGDGLGNPNIFILACTAGVDHVENNDDCNDNSIIDPTLTISLIENSGIAINDGNICSSGTAMLTVIGGINYLWSTGAISNSINVSPTGTTTFTVTVTLMGGNCYNVIPFYIYVESNVVKNTANQGNGSLRNVLFCAAEGSVITYDLPAVSHTVLTSPLVIDKNNSILGNVSLHPDIKLNFNSMTQGIQINNTKILTFENVDITTINAGSLPTFMGQGHIEVRGGTKVKKQ